MMAKVKKLYIGKTCEEYKNGEVIEVELSKDGSLPASLVGRVRDAVEGTDSKSEALEVEVAELKESSDALEKENAELKKEVAELKKQLSTKK